MEVSDTQQTWGARIGRRAFLCAAGGAVFAVAGCATRARDRGTASWIGYTEFRTNLPTRYDNEITARAHMVRADGTGRRALAESLTREPHTWTQFAGWSPDGTKAVIGHGWKSPETGAWEDAHKTFRFDTGIQYDVYLLDLEGGELTNLTAVERVSNYNSGLIFLAGSPPRLGFTAIIDGVSHPFAMDLDGRNKRDLSTTSEGFTYGFTASPDGALLAYHKDYQIYIAEADGSGARRVETGNPFNFVPRWSPDGTRLLFVSGEHYNCDPHVVNRDGTGLRRIASRGSYQGWVAFLDVPDFHNGSSDLPVWDAEGRGIFFAKQLAERTELFWAGLDGSERQITHSAPGALHYHPTVSPDGARLLFGSTRDGRRQLYVMPVDCGEARPITSVSPGHGAMWGHWAPSGV